MSLIGKNNEEKILNFLKSKGINDYGCAGLMGNLYCESGLSSINLQNNGNRELGMTDQEYVNAVDSGIYCKDKFIKDGFGIGLAQWTYYSRKQKLYEYAKCQNKSIGDLEVQLCFLYKELCDSYKSVLGVLKTATSVLDASNAVLLKFEVPANRGEEVQKKRASYGQMYYDKYAVKNDVVDNSESNSNIVCGETSNSSLVSFRQMSPNHSGKRKHSIDRITPHVYVGQVSVERMGRGWANKGNVSANYGIGSDGRIGLYVDEANRSWCSSSKDNDNRAITIECASDTREPYTINDKVYRSLVKLMADICKRNGKNKLIWFLDKNKSLNYKPSSNEMIITVHRWFASKSCPGDYVYNRLGKIADEVNNILNCTDTALPPTQNETEKENPPSSQVVPFKPYRVKVTTGWLNIRSGAGKNYDVCGTIRDKGVYTIVGEANGDGATKWLRLKSSAGWIASDYTAKI